MSPVASSLIADGVSWRYGRGPWVLRDVTFTAGPGELLRVRGGNGSGKSTLLALVAGVVTSSRGAVRTPGRTAYLPQRVFDPHPATLGDVALGTGLHLAGGMSGVGMALLLHALGAARGVQAAVVVLVGLVSGQVAALPPIGPVLAAWASDRNPGTAVAVWSVVGPVLLGGVLVTGTAAVRRRRA